MARPPDPDRKREILSRAVIFLADHGLSNLSMRRLATAMGTSTNTISYQFGSKQGLVDAALQHCREVTLDRLEEVRGQEGSCTVADGILHLWDWWTQDRRNLVYTRLNMEAMMASADELDGAHRPELLTFWTDYFANWIQAERSCGRADALTESTLLMAVISGLVVDLQSTGDAARATDALIRHLGAS